MKIEYYSFKNLLLCHLIIFTAIGTIEGLCVLAQLDSVSVKWNGEPVYGLTGFLLCFIVSPLAGILLACLNYLLINGGRVIHNFLIKPASKSRDNSLKL